MTPPPPMTPDYLAQARALLSGDTALVPSLDHLRALQAEVNQIALLVALQNRALVALLLDRSKAAVTVPATLIGQIEAMGLDVSIQRQQGGPLHVALVRFAPGETPHAH